MLSISHNVDIKVLSDLEFEKFKLHVDYTPECNTIFELLEDFYNSFLFLYKCAVGWSQVFVNQEDPEQFYLCSSSSEMNCRFIIEVPKDLLNLIILRNSEYDDSIKELED